MNFGLAAVIRNEELFLVMWPDHQSFITALFMDLVGICDSEAQTKACVHLCIYLSIL